MLSILRPLAAGALALLLSICPSLAAEGSAALLPNGDFETSSGSPAWPEKWARPKGGITLETEDGNHFLRFTSTEPGEMVMLYQPVTIPPQVKGLELTWRQRVTGLKVGKQAWFDARILLDFKNEAGEKMKGGPGAPATRKDEPAWVEKKLQFAVPEGARSLDFMPALFNVQAGTLDLDDVVLRAVDGGPLQEAAAAAGAARDAKLAQEAEARRAKAAKAAPAGASLIPNGNLEAEAKGGGWADKWGRPKSGGTWEVENGNHFLRLKAAAPGQMTMIYQAYDLPAGTKALEFTWRQRITDLKPGRETYFDARILLEFKNAAGQKIKGGPGAPYTRKSTDGWVERSVKFLVPDDALTLEFMPSLFQVERGTFDLDDLALRPIDAVALLAEKETKAAETKAAEVPVEAPQPTKFPPALHVAGNKLLAANGQEVWLQGVNIVSLEWNPQGEQIMKAAKTAIEQWKANIFRLPVKESYWFGKEGPKDGGKAYRELVDHLITLAANRGAYVLLDLHRFKAPRAEHLEFWKDAAARYKDHPAVLFDLFNEPHGTSWEVWRNGGFVAEKKKASDEDSFTTPEEKAKAAKGFEAVGMQALVNAVREIGARNVVVAGGLDWAYDLSGITQGFALEEKGGHGIAYSTHIYPWKKGWAEKVLTTAEKYPILVGELGANTKKMEFIPANGQEDAATWVPAMLGLIQKYHLHWTAFSFHPKSAPVLITGWDYTPTPEWGAPAKRALAGEKFELNKLR